MQMQVIIDRFLRSEKSRLLNLKPLDKLLMFFLASYMGKKNSCFPSYPTLMADLGINDKTALSNSLKRLSSLNILFIQKQKGKSHIFSFNMDFIPVGNPYGGRRENPSLPVGNPYTNNAFNNINNKNEIFNKNENQKPQTEESKAIAERAREEIRKLCRLKKMK